MTTRTRTPEEYRAYLLRLWRTDEQQEPAWRCSIEDTATHQRRGFEDVEALASYLRGTFSPAVAEPRRPRGAKTVTSRAARRAGTPGPSGCRG